MVKNNRGRVIVPLLLYQLRVAFYCLFNPLRLYAYISLRDRRATVL